MLGRVPAQPFFPTLERARESGLDIAQYPPDEQAKLVALVVAARVSDARTNQVKTMFETYLPEQLTVRPRLFELEKSFELRCTPGTRPPPEVLRCHDLKPVRVGGAYRSAQTEKQPDFFGYELGDTIEQAGEALRRFFLGTTPRRFDILAWAWPLLWIENRQLDAEAVLWVDRLGVVASFVASTRDD